MISKKQKWIKRIAAIAVVLWLAGFVYAFGSVTPTYAAGAAAPAAAGAAGQPAAAPAAAVAPGATPAAAVTQDSDTVKLLNDINAIAGMALRLLSGLLWPVLLLIGSLLDNQLVFGGAMGDRLYEVWVQIRNLVNIIFVLILLAIAVYNVLGLGQEGGLDLGFKKALPKFALALLGVNFSFIAIKIVLDFSNVITGAVFALPSAALSGDADLNKQMERSICGVSSEEAPLRGAFCDDQHFNVRAKQFFNRLDKNNIAVVYAIKFGKAINMKYIRDGVKDITSLGFNIIFNVVIFAVYALSFIALFLVLLFRLVVIWVAVVLSPVMALGIALPGLSKLAEGGGEIQGDVVQNIIAPITIGLVLSVGYIMLDTFSVNSSLAGELLSSNTLESIDPSAVPTDIDNLQQLLIAVGSVVIIWVGVFKAADKTYAKGITSKIQSGAESFGGFMAKLPTYAPLIPMNVGGDNKKLSVSNIFESLKRLPGKISGEQEVPIWQMGNKGAEAAAEPMLKAAKLGAKEWAKEFANAPELLHTKNGWNSFEHVMTNDPKIAMKPQEFKDKYGSGPDDYLKAARELGRDEKALSAGLRQSLEDAHIDPTKIEDEIKKRETAKKQTETKPAPVAPVALPKVDALALLNKSPAEAAQNDTFKKGGWTQPELEKYKDQLATISGPLKEALVITEGDHIKKVSQKDFQDAQTLFGKIDVTSDLNVATTAVDATLTTNPTIDRALIGSIVKASKLPDPIKAALTEKIDNFVAPQRQ